jgi:hypothetical protein
LRTADIAVGFLDDRKVQRAIRAAGSDAVVAYLAVILGAARDEDGATFAEELPLYLEDRADELLAVLVRVGLLEADGTIAERAFERWLRPGIEAAQRKRTRDREHASLRRRSRVASDSLATDRRQTDDTLTTARRSLGPVPSRTSLPIREGRDGSTSTDARATKLLEDDDPLGPLPPSTTAEERRNGAKGPDIPPGPAPAVSGRSGPPCRLSRELFRAHSSSHVIRGGELVGCTACDRDAADRRSFREKLETASATAGSP